MSFIFPNRTGLFMNQFFTMILSERLSMEMFPDMQTRRDMTLILAQTKSEEWSNDKEFTTNLSTLIKQAKTANPY